MSIFNGDNEQKPKSLEFSKSKGHNSAEKYSTGPKFEFNLHIFVTQPRCGLEFRMSIFTGDNLQKLIIIRISLSPP